MTEFDLIEESYDDGRKTEFSLSVVRDDRPYPANEVLLASIRYDLEKLIAFYEERPWGSYSLNVHQEAYRQGYETGLAVASKKEDE